MITTTIIHVMLSLFFFRPVRRQSSIGSYTSQCQSQPYEIALASSSTMAGQYNETEIECAHRGAIHAKQSSFLEVSFRQKNREKEEWL